MANDTFSNISAEIRARAGAWRDRLLKQYDLQLADRIDAAAEKAADTIEYLRKTLESIQAYSGSVVKHERNGQQVPHAAENILVTTEHALHALFSGKKMTAEEFKRRFDVRYCERSCYTCKYGVDMCDDGCYWCKHPAVAEDSLYTSEGHTCCAWEADK